MTTHFTPAKHLEQRIHDVLAIYPANNPAEMSYNDFSDEDNIHLTNYGSCFEDIIPMARVHLIELENNLVQVILVDALGQFHICIVNKPTFN